MDRGPTPGTAPDEDSRMVALSQAGDRAAFEDLVRKYQHRIFNLCRRFFPNDADAEDAAQETFIRAFEGLKRFRQDAAFATWLYRIAVNHCNNRLTSLSYRLGKVMTRLGPDDANDPAPEIAASDPAPPDLLEQRMRREAIAKAIAALPLDQKTLVILRDVEGLSYEEVATITNLNLGTVKSKLARGRERLRTRLQGVV